MNAENSFLIRNRWTLTIGILLVGALLVVVINPLTGQGRISLDNPFWFVGLLVTFAGALTLVAVVFRWLGIENREEAFALPSGSIRTLLAVGVMVLFAFFGLTFFDKASNQGPPVRTAERPVRDVEAPSEAKALAAEIARYERYGFAVVVASPGGTGTPPANARLELYRQEANRPADLVDMQKQVLTAVATLLTTVIGFYFGSRSAEGARAPTTPGAPTDDGGQALGKGVDEQLARWKTLQAAPVPGGDPTAAAAIATQRSQAEAAVQRLEAARQALTGAAAGDRAARTDRVRQELQTFERELTELERLLAAG